MANNNSYPELYHLVDLEEHGWCFYVTCMDCDRHTVEVEYRSPDKREEAARQAAYLWNVGKLLTGTPGE